MLLASCALCGNFMVTLYVILMYILKLKEYLKDVDLSIVSDAHSSLLAT